MRFRVADWYRVPIWVTSAYCQHQSMISRSIDPYRHPLGAHHNQIWQNMGINATKIAAPMRFRVADWCGVPRRVAPAPFPSPPVRYRSIESPLPPVPSPPQTKSFQNDWKCCPQRLQGGSLVGWAGSQALACGPWTYLEPWNNVGAACLRIPTVGPGDEGAQPRREPWIFTK